MKPYKPLIFNGRLELFATITAMLVYVCGVGRYRFVLTYAAFLFVNSLFAACRKPFKEFLLVVVVILSLILDIKYGPLYPVYDFNSILLAGILLVVGDATVRKLLLSKRAGAESTDVKEAEVIHSIVNKENENGILFEMKLPRHISYYKNGTRVLRNEFFMMKDCIAIFERIESKSWRDGDIIFYKDILAITGEMKKSFISKSPFMTINCKNGTILEIVSPGYYQHVAQVQAVAKKMNPEILIGNSLPDKPVCWMLE